MAFNLLGMFQPQPDQLQSLLGEYYSPQQARMSWLGGTLQGLGAGLASGRPGAWAQGAIAGGNPALEDYQRRALAMYGVKQRADENAYQHGRDAKADQRYEQEWKARQKQAADAQAWTNTLRDHQLEQWNQEDTLRQGQQNAVEGFNQKFTQQGGNLFSPEMQYSLRQAGVQGVSPQDTQRYDAMQPYVQAGDYGNAFQQMVAQPQGGEGFTLSPGQVRYGPHGEKVAEGPPAQPDSNNNPFQNAYKLRKEYMDETKPYTDLRTNYQKIEASSKDQTGASDIALVYSFMKMLDPTSVVREGEFATAANAGGVDSKIVSLYNNVLNGQKLSPQVRQEFVQQAGRQYEQQLQTYKQVQKKYEGLAQRYGLAPEDVAPDITYGVQAMPQPVVTQDGYTIEPVSP